MDCKFCNIVKKKSKDYIVWENRKFMAFLDTHPAKSGHCMLIPKKHIDYFFDLDNKTYLELFSVAKRLEKPLKKAMRAKKIGLSIVGFNTCHAHLHLVPLHGPNQMYELVSCKATKEELKKVQKKLVFSFNK